MMKKLVIFWNVKGKVFFKYSLLEEFFFIFVIKKNYVVVVRI